MQIRLLAADDPLKLGDARSGFGATGGGRHPTLRPRLRLSPAAPCAR